MGAKMEIFADRTAAYGADRGGARRVLASGGVKDSAAPLTLQEDFAPLYRNERNEKHAQVVIQPLQARGREPAARAETFRIPQRNFLRLHAAHEDEDGPPFQRWIDTVITLSQESRRTMSQRPSRK